MSGLQFFAVDLETNGLQAKGYYHEVTEISIIRAETRVQLFRQIRCHNPLNSSMDALKITGKTLADLENGVSREQAVEECDRFFNQDGLTPAHRCIIGHNIYSFDRKFLFALWETVGKVFPATLWLDTLQMSRAYAKQLGLVKPKTNLQAACNLVGIKKAAGLHNARSDARNAYLLWKDLVEVKGMDHLSFIKTSVHEYIDPDVALAALDEETDLSQLDFDP